MAQLENCPRCGRLFVRTVRSVCQDCHAENERQFKLVYDFVRKKENRQATIYEASEGTGVSVAQIKEYIRQGRLALNDLPNMGYPCESCGEEMIREGKLCDDCRRQLLSGMERVVQEPRERPRYYNEPTKGYRQLKPNETDDDGRR